MIDSAALVGLTIAGLSLLVSAVAILLADTARTSPLLLAGCAAALLAGTSVDATGRSEWTSPVLTTAGVLGCFALATYPRVRWRHPVDFLCLALLVGTGLAMVLWSPGGGEVGSLGLLLGVTLIGHTWWRIDVSRGAERRALGWMAASAGACALAVGVASFATASAQSTAIATATVAIIGPAMYVGVTLPDIVDVRGLVVSVTVFTVSVFAYVAVFVPIVRLLDDRAGRSLSTGAAALVGAVLAAGFHPLQRRLRGTVDAVLFGLRPDPLVAATRLAGGIGEDPARALDAICESLVLPWAELRVDGQVLATSGRQVPHTRTVVVDESAELVVGLRPGDLSLPDDDRRVLALTAPLLSQLLRARSLAADLADSRGQTVAAREEERRRLRRDLHDGLGPRLTGVAFASDAARNLVRNDPAGADEVLARLRDETATAIEEIRQIVYAMRPPALDELGLVAALRQHAHDLRHADGTLVAVVVETDGELGPLPAAVEVAAYRIVTEALTNVVRHSDGDRARVRLALGGGDLLVEVSDTGSGGGPWTAGVGLSSMRERADELGGRLVASAGPDGGRVSARLPLL